jgi:hypothetical protein
MRGPVPDLDALSRSGEWSDRVEAANLAAAGAPEETEAIVLRLLRDPLNTAVTQSMTEELLQQRGATAIALVLRSLGTPTGADANHDEPGEQMLWSLQTGGNHGIDTEGAIIEALVESGDRSQTLGALDAIGWMAPLGNFAPSAEATALLDELTRHADAEVSRLALYARKGLDEGRARRPR